MKAYAVSAILSEENLYTKNLYSLHKTEDSAKKAAVDLAFLLEERHPQAFVKTVFESVELQD